MDVDFSAVYTSDLTRAVHTAELLNQQPVHKDNQLFELRERSYGSLDGKPSKHLIKGSELKKLLSEDESWHYKYVPDMESDHELIVRYMAVLEKLAKANPGKTILIVAHGTAIRITLRKILGLRSDKFPSGSFKNTDHAIVDYEDGVFTVVEAPDHE
jgi:broad specificity phosphatase PhoE